MHRSSTYYENGPKTVLKQYVGGFWCERKQEINFFIGGSIIMDYGLSLKFYFCILIIYLKKIA